MKKILILLLCIFTLSIGQIRSESPIKFIKVNVPSKISICYGKPYSINVLDSTMNKYITMSYKDSVLYITSMYEFEQPLNIRITTPDSLQIITNRNHKIIR
jgi:hypothetical protein